MYLQDNYTSKTEICQELKRLEQKKHQHDFLKKYYLRAFDIANKNAKSSISNFQKCGDYVWIKDNKIHSANFCKQRYCPICQWRLSKKVYHEINTVIDAVNAQYNVKYILVTLTIRNMDKLSEGITTALQGFKLFFKRREVVKAFKGFIRTLEITRSGAGQWHPHIHCICAVGEEYWTDAYIEHSRLIELWQQATGAEYAPNVDIRLIKGNITDAVAEVAKYAVKPFDLTNEIHKAEILAELIQATYKRRLRSMGGIIKKTAKSIGITLEDEDEYSPYDWDSNYVYDNGKYIIDEDWRQKLQQKENVTRQTLAKGVS